MFDRSQGDPPETPNKLIPRLKNPLFPQAETGTKLLKRRKNLYVDLQQFATLFLPQESAVFSPDGNSPGNTMENSGKQNPKMGFKPPPSRGDHFSHFKHHKLLLLIDLDCFAYRKICRGSFCAPYVTHGSILTALSGALCSRIRQGRPIGLDNF